MPITLIEQNPSFNKKITGEDKLAIAEMFSDTLQGEGINTGTPATFIRLQGCTLKCKWCFYESTKIVMEKGKSKKIKDLKVGDTLLTLDKNENLVETTVKSILESEVSVDEMMALYFDQKQDAPIICTRDHPFFVKGKGWIKAIDIKENDIVLGPSKKQVQSRKMSSYNNQKEKRFNFVFNGSQVTKINKSLTNKQKARLYGKSNIQNVKVYNLSCEPYNTYLIDNGVSHHKWVHNCDTLDVWPHGNEYSFEELFQLFDDIGLPERLKSGQHLVLTGGSPLKQQSKLYHFIQAFLARYKFKPYIEIENEGVLLAEERFAALVDCWNNSPKLSNSGMKEKIRIKPEVIKQLNQFKNSWFKFVITSEADWEEILRDYLPLVDKEKIILMPEGVTQEELNQRREFVAEMAIKYSVRFSDRLHVTVWNEKTGV